MLSVLNGLVFALQVVFIRFTVFATTADCKAFPAQTEKSFA